MNTQLRENWLKRLDAARFDPAWSAQIEVRVLRFLLSRYEGAEGESPVPVQPLFGAASLEAEAKAPFKPLSRLRTLRRIAYLNGKAPRKPACSAFEDVFVQQPSYREIRRRQKKKGRGYW